MPASIYSVIVGQKLILMSPMWRPLAVLAVKPDTTFQEPSQSKMERKRSADLFDWKPA